MDVDSPTILDALTAVQGEIVRRGCDVKLVERENIHLTLRFLGELPQGLVEEVRRALDKLSGQPFTMRLRGLGAFPNLTRPRVVWVGVAEGFDELKSLRSQIDELLRPLRIPPEKEEFTPHVTLARVKSPRNVAGLVDLIRSLSERDFGSQEVRAVKLKRSVLTPRGPIYSDIYVRELR